MISVVIPTYNRSDLLKVCLEGLSYDKQGLTEKDYEVIVTDDSKNDITKDMISAEFPSVRYVRGPQKGPASNRNNGAHNANGEWVAFIDDDCIPQGIIIKSYLKGIAENPDVKVFEGAIAVDRPRKHYLEESPLNLTGGFFWSCNIMLKKTFFEELGGFDEDFPFPAMEDVEIHVRIKKSGQKIVFVKDAKVVHPWRLQTDKINYTKKSQVSEDYFYKKHPELLKRQSFSDKMKIEARFYLKTILSNVIAYRGRGMMTLIKAHLLLNKLRETRLKQSGL